MSNFSLIHDVFPAIVSIATNKTRKNVHDLVPHSGSEGYVDRCRVIVTSEVVVIAADAPTGPQIVFQEAYDTLFDPKPEEDRKIIRIVTVSGKMLAFTKQEGCACGSRLRAWNPYKTIVSQKGVK